MIHDVPLAKMGAVGSIRVRRESPRRMVFPADQAEQRAVATSWSEIGKFASCPRCRPHFPWFRTVSIPVGPRPSPLMAYAAPLSGPKAFGFRGRWYRRKSRLHPDRGSCPLNLHLPMHCKCIHLLHGTFFHRVQAIRTR